MVQSPKEKNIDVRPLWQKIIFYPLALIFLSLPVVRSMDWLMQSGKPDPMHVEQALRNALPPGIPKAQANSYLTQQHIEHSSSNQPGVLYAIVRNTRGSNWLIQQDLTMQLHFGPDERLISINFKEEYTGP